MCDQIASADELAAFGRRLVEDLEAREYYIACLETHARLAWQMVPGKPFLLEELVSYTAVDETPSFIPPIVVDPIPRRSLVVGQLPLLLLGHGDALRNRRVDRLGLEDTQ